MSENGARHPERVTLRSVASRAGVSVSTASLVFSGKGAVATDTRNRVRHAAEELGYRGPDPLASSLRRGRSGVVAVVVEERLLFAFRDPYAVSRLDGLASVLDEIPASMLLVSQPDVDVAGTVARLAASAIDAAVFFGYGPSDGPVLDALLARGVPLVAMDTPVAEGVVRVGVDDRAASAEATRHLLDLGHERVGHVLMPCEDDAEVGSVRPAGDWACRRYTTVRQRLAGVIDAAGPDVPTVRATSSDVEAGRAAGGAILDLPDRPSAVVAQSDTLAVGVIRAALERGLAVPRDLSVVGFDGIVQSWWPGRLTTVEQPAAGKGRAAGALVREMLAGRRPDNVRLPTRLRVGDSTAPPP